MAYYRRRLSAKRLRRCYEIAPPRIKRYLDAEIEFVISNIENANGVLELGCGYGRVMKEVSQSISWLIGIDISKESLKLVEPYMKSCQNYTVSLMDASQLGFRAGTFDAVFCIQNGISAFGVDKKRLIAESVRVTRDNGVILFSSYSPKIWEARLKWFEKQARFGLVGEIDMEKTRNGTIVCKDGFRTTTISGDQFIGLFAECGLEASIVEVEESSLFCRAIKEEGISC